MYYQATIFGTSMFTRRGMYWWSRCKHNLIYEVLTATTYLWCDVIVEITDNRYSLLPWRRAALDWTDIIHLSIRLKAPSQNLLSTKLQYNITAPTGVVEITPILCLTITRHWLCSYYIHKYVYPYDKLHVQKTLSLLVLSTRKTL